VNIEYNNEYLLPVVGHVLYIVEIGKYLTVEIDSSDQSQRGDAKMHNRHNHLENILSNII
jgi:hypothetical protein